MLKNGKVWLQIDHAGWCSMIRDGVILFESQRHADRHIKRQKRKERQADNFETEYIVWHLWEGDTVSQRLVLSATLAVTTELRPVSSVIFELEGQRNKKSERRR